MTRRRRNDPCWCDSGKTLASCHGVASAVPGPAAHIHALDETLVEPLLVFATQRFKPRLVEVLNGYTALCAENDSADVHLPFMMPWAYYEVRFDDHPLVDWFLAERRDTLTADQAAWIESQRRSWLSVWEVDGVDPGNSLSLRDLLTGATRVVTERKCSYEVPAGYAILARVVDHGGFSVLCGVHPHPLGPPHLTSAVLAIRTSLRIKSGFIDVEALRAADSFRMIRFWQAALDALAPIILRRSSRTPEARSESNLG
jgi:hypothetical protein